MRILILGAGAVGAMSAWRLALAGHDVTVLEQFALDHDRGSSYGESRIVRRVYADPFYTRLMAEAYPLWEELQAQCSEEVFATVGGVFFGPPECRDMREAGAALLESGVPFERLEARECARRYPALRLRSDEIALYEPSMSYARATHAVRAAARLAQRSGANFQFGTQVQTVEAGKNGSVQVTTTAGEILVADSLLISAGPWAGPLLKKLGVSIPVQVMRKTYVHLEPQQNKADFEVGRFPIWIDAVSLAYGFPHLGEIPGVKLAFHGGGEVTSPEAVVRELSDEDRRPLLEYAGARFPNLSSKITYEKVCLYTNTPDEDFVVDEVPGLPGAYFVAGLSGHGFKFAPLLGEIALNLLIGDGRSRDLSRFELARFSRPKVKTYGRIVFG